MPRPRKFRNLAGRYKTTLYRSDQFAQIKDLAQGLGVEVSDVVRALLDHLRPTERFDRAVRFRAALEVLWRRLSASPALASVLREYWRGRKEVLGDAGLDAATRRDLNRALYLVRELKVAGPPKKGARVLVDDWAALAPLALLEVLASEAVRVLEVDDAGAPTKFLAIDRILPWDTDRDGKDLFSKPIAEERHAYLAGRLDSVWREGADVAGQEHCPTGLAGACFSIDWERLRRDR